MKLSNHLPQKKIISNDKTLLVLFTIIDQSFLHRDPSSRIFCLIFFSLLLSEIVASKPFLTLHYKQLPKLQICHQNHLFVSK